MHLQRIIGTFIQRKPYPAYKTEDITCGDVMTIEEFKTQVLLGGFIDDDGFGVFATSEKRTSYMTLLPSNINSWDLSDNPELTHIVWFNT